MLCPRAAELQAASLGSTPRSRARRGDSKLGGFPSCMIPQCLFGERIELSGPNILLKLPVPDLLIVSDEPLAEGRQLFGGKLLHLTFKILHLAHGATSIG